jgi:hypothetical protein
VESPGERCTLNREAYSGVPSWATRTPRVGAGTGVVHSASMTWDPFQILGLEGRFDLPGERVLAAYVDGARRLHALGPSGGDARDAGPDARVDDVDRDERLAALNRAKAVLEDPEQRAEALLTLLGGPSKESDRSLPPGFLAQIMEVRERLDEAMSTRAGGGASGAVSGGASGKAKSAPDEVDALLRWAEGRREAHRQRVGELFGSMSTSANAAPATRDALVGVRRELNAWRYIERMIEQIEQMDQGGPA